MGSSLETDLPVITEIIMIRIGKCKPQRTYEYKYYYAMLTISSHRLIVIDESGAK